MWNYRPRSTAPRATASTCKCRTCSSAQFCAHRSKAPPRTRSMTPRQGTRRCGQDRPAAVWGRRARRDAVGRVRGAPGARRDLDQDRDRLGLRQRKGYGAIRRRCQESRQGATDWSRMATSGARCRRLPVRSKPSIAAITPIMRRWSRSTPSLPWRPAEIRSKSGRDAKPEHRAGSPGQGAWHPARQGQAQRHADGRWLRPAWQSRRRIHH